MDRKEQFMDKMEQSPPMEPVLVVDARMGRGKTRAAIQYMNEHHDERFMYVTPYLKEVDRICKSCGFVQPSEKRNSKLTDLKRLLRNRDSVAITHSLYSMLDEGALDVVRKGEYRLIIDESPMAIQQNLVTLQDYSLVNEKLVRAMDDTGRLSWIAPKYDGMFNGFRKKVEANLVYFMDRSIIELMNPALLLSFKDVTLLTYMFSNQYMRAYMDLFKIPYNIGGIDTASGIPRFTDLPDNPPPANFDDLIDVCDNPRLTAFGEEAFTLSHSWYQKAAKYNPSEIKSARNLLRWCFNNSKGRSADFMWTCYKEEAPKLFGDRNRFARSFVQSMEKATNDYRDRNVLVYMVNVFCDPDILRFFSHNDIEFDQNGFALSNMVQWIWRSAIRENKSIKVYIPSKRMRTLFTDWLDQNK